MKDIIKRSIIGIFSSAFIAYIAYTISQGSTIVTSEYIHLNQFTGIILLAIGAYFLMFFAIRPIYMKITKATVFVVGIAMIFFGHHVLINNPEVNVYIGDITKLVGVILTILSPTKLLISEKQKKKKQDSKMKIIEA